MPRAERIIEPVKKALPVLLPHVLKEGYLYKKSRYLKKWKLRWVVVMSNGTAYTYLTSENKSQATETFNLIAFMLDIRFGDKPNTFLLLMEE